MTCPISGFRNTLESQRSPSKHSQQRSRHKAQSARAAAARPHCPRHGMPGVVGWHWASHKWNFAQSRLDYLSSITKECDTTQAFIQGVKSLQFRARWKAKAITITTSKSFSIQVFKRSLQKYFTQSNSSTPMFSCFFIHN
jgi:hypothetical protein